jgi:hypothetical protein
MSTAGVITAPTGPVTTSDSGGGSGSSSALSHPGSIAAVALGALLFSIVVIGG